MKMKMAVRKRYLRFLLPAILLCLLLALLLLWISGFGFRYLLRKPAQLSELPLDGLKGSYVTMPVTEAGEQFTYLGYQDSTGNPVITEEYTVCKLRGKYLMIRVTKKDLPVLDKYLHAAELVQSGKMASSNLFSFFSSTLLIFKSFSDFFSSVEKATFSRYKIKE